MCWNPNYVLGIETTATERPAQRRKEVVRAHVGTPHGCCIAPKNADNMSDINYDLQRGCSFATISLAHRAITPSTKAIGHLTFALACASRAIAPRGLSRRDGHGRLGPSARRRRGRPRAARVFRTSRGAPTGCGKRFALSETFQLLLSKQIMDLRINRSEVLVNYS